MKMHVAVAVVGLIAGGCASGGGGGSEPAPSKAMSRVPASVRTSAEGYIEALNAIATTLAKVTDTASARGAMPGLEGQLAELSRHWRALEAEKEKRRAEARYAFSEALGAADRRFDSQVSRMKGTPGVGSVLAPLLDKIPRWR